MTQMVNDWTEEEFCRDKPRAEPSRRSVAEALVKESKPGEVVAYFCTNCGTVYSDKNGTGKEDAERCTVRRIWNRDGDRSKDCTEWSCEKCGEPCLPYQWFCHKCQGSHYERQEKEKLAKAEVVPDYPDDQGVVWNGDYYQCIEDLIEHCEYDDIPVPDRVWATAPVPFALNADRILEHTFEEWSEGADDVDFHFCGEDEFKAAVAAFNEANKNKVLFFETSKAVDLTAYQGDGDEE